MRLAAFGNNSITGNDADNHLTGNAGIDLLDGGNGTDYAIYSGNLADYQQTHNSNGSWTIVDLRSGSPDGTDTLQNIELLQFHDGVVSVGANQVADIQPPTILTFSADTGTVGDHITSDNTLTFTGTAAANSTIKIYDGGTLLGTSITDANGSWNYTTAALSDGGHNVTATATDGAGTTSDASTGLSVTVDTVAPNAPIIAGYSPDSATAGDGITNVNVLTLTGSAEAGSAVHVYDAALLLGVALADGNGAWSFTTYDAGGAGNAGFVCMCPACVAARAAEKANGGGVTTSLSDGHHAFTVVAVDAAGNTSVASTALGVTIDTAAPSAPTIASFSTDTGALGDHITADKTPTLTGTAEADSTVKLSDNGTLIATVTANASGA